jgi:hypothetical protein
MNQPPYNSGIIPVRSAVDRPRGDAAQDRDRSSWRFVSDGLECSSGPSFLNISCARWTIAIASSRVPEAENAVAELAAANVRHPPTINLEVKAPALIVLRGGFWR